MVRVRARARARVRVRVRAGARARARVRVTTSGCGAACVAAAAVDPHSGGKFPASFGEAVGENEVYWSTSTWLALQAQRLSVAVHIASAWEITTAMQLAGAWGWPGRGAPAPLMRHKKE